jgi:hypothetical protein
MLSKTSIFGMDTFGSSTQIRSNGHRQSPSTKRVKIRFPFAVVDLMVVRQSNLIHLLDVHTVVRPVLFGCCVCFGHAFSCLSTTVLEEMTEMPSDQFCDYRRSDPLNANFRPKYRCVLLGPHSNQPNRELARSQTLAFCMVYLLLR